MFDYYVPVRLAAWLVDVVRGGWWWLPSFPNFSVDFWWLEWYWMLTDAASSM